MKMNSTSDALSLRTRKTKTQKLPGKKKTEKFASRNIDLVV